MVSDKELDSLEITQTHQAAELLARAFRDDPMYTLVLPNTEKRFKMLSWLFSRVIRYSLLYGKAYTIGNLEGVALWLPPKQTEMSFGRVLRSGLYATPLKMGLAAYRRFDTYMRYATELHKRNAPKAHWYLWAIGVEPSAQGRGIGSKLIKVILERASAEGIACYLETGMERNIRFYEKHGFEVVEEGKVPGQRVQVWAMLRKEEGT